MCAYIVSSLVDNTHSHSPSGLIRPNFAGRWHGGACTKRGPRIASPTLGVILELTSGSVGGLRASRAFLPNLELEAQDGHFYQVFVLECLIGQLIDTAEPRQVVDGPNNRYRNLRVLQERKTSPSLHVSFPLPRFISQQARDWKNLRSRPSAVAPKPAHHDQQLQQNVNPHLNPGSKSSSVKS